MVTRVEKAVEAILEHLKTCPKCAAMAKLFANREIAENLKDFWRHLQSGAEQC